MKYLKMIPFLLVIVTIFLLQLFENQFQFTQNMLVLESNLLLSSQHVMADDSAYSTWKISQKPDDHFRIFGKLDDDAKKIVIAFYSTDYSTDQMPISSGLFFSKADSKEAIVGKDVSTTVINGVEYFNYNNTNYPVLGKLGISSNSPLKNTILINDSALLKNPGISLVFDGPDINKISWLKSNPMENKGVERWFNISFLSKWIEWTTILVIAFSSIFASYFYIVATNETRRVKFQTGIAIKKIFITDILTLTAILLLLGLLTFFTIIIFKLKFAEFNLFISYLVFYVCLLLSCIMLSTHQFSRERFE